MRIRVLKYFHIDLAGNIAEMCGTDSVLPFQDERRSVMSNIKLAEKHTEFMIKRGAVAVQAFHWRGLNNDTPIGDMVYLVSDKVVNRQKQKHTKTDIVPIGVTIEYKNQHFADVYVVRRGIGLMAIVMRIRLKIKSGSLSAFPVFSIRTSNLHWKN